MQSACLPGSWLSCRVVSGWSLETLADRQSFQPPVDLESGNMAMMAADDSGGSGNAGGALVAAENSGIRGLQGEAAGMVADALALPAARVGLWDGLTIMHSYVARMVHAKPYLIKRAPLAQSSHEASSVESAMTHPQSGRC